MKPGTWLRLAAAAVLAAVLFAGVAEAKKKSKGEAEITHTVCQRRFCYAQLVAHHASAARCSLTSRSAASRPVRRCIARDGATQQR